MGKNVTKNSKADRRPKPRRYLRAGALAGLVVVGVGAMFGMAMFNRSAKPNRDMQWYMKPGAVEVAAPPLGEGYASAQAEEMPEALAAGEARPAVTEAPSIGQTPEVLQEDARLDATEALSAETTDGAQALADETEAASTDAATEALSAEATDGAQALAVEPESDAIPASAGSLEPDASQQAVPSGPVTITVTAAGDCTFGGQEGAKGKRRFTQYAKDKGYDYFFDGVRSIFENDDLTIVNLEGPLTTVAKTSKKAEFIFKGDPDYVNILTGSSVELCNVANNHSKDYGVEGLKETAQVLDAAGIGYCGYSQAYYTTIKGVRVGALGFTWWDSDKKDVAEAVAEARKNCDLLIVSMHWGLEYHYDQSVKQEELGHAIIDAGADLVIGTHPHVFQGIEKYKGKYIVYSLGNFCFAGNANPADKRCLIFQQSFSFTPGMGIVQAGIMDEGINIIPTSISSTKELNDFQPTVMDAKTGAKLLKSVASHSEGIAFDSALWMKDNYLTANGLIDGDAGETGEAGEGAAA